MVLNKMQPTIIFGASPQGRVALDILRAQGQYEILGFLDDNTALHKQFIDGVPVLGGIAWAYTHSHQSLAAIVAIGNTDIRLLIGDKLRDWDFTLINAIHPSAVVMEYTVLGTGNLICANVVLATGVCLENDIVINTGTTIDHDSFIQTGAQVASGVHTAGCITIGKKAFVGVGAVLGPNVTIGEGCIVGAGSVVLSDIPPHTLAFGTPAKVIRDITEPVDWRRVLANQ
jgi:sugar O-acyltransferase (sialic acid O-acetyltransferase NeuD family)